MRVENVEFGGIQPGDLATVCRGMAGEGRDALLRLAVRRVAVRTRSASLTIGGASHRETKPM